MKRFTLLKTMLLLCALIVGSTSLWAETVTYTLTISPSDFNTTSYAANNNEKTTNAVCTTDNTKTFEVKWTSNQVMLNSSNMQWQKSKGYIYNSTDLGTITSVTVNKTAGSFTTYYGTSEQPSSGTAGAGKGFFKTSVGSATGTTSSVVVTFQREEGPADTRTDTAVEIDASGITNTNRYTGTAAGTLAATVKAGETTVGSSVTWSGDNDEVATINASTGAVTLVAAGTVTFTASYAGDEDYKPSTNTYELTVINENPNAITLWSEDFSDYHADDVPNDKDGYSVGNGNGTTKIYSANLAGGSSPELLVAKSNGYFQATIPLNNVQGSLELKFKKNGYALSVSTTTEGVSGGDSFSDAGEKTVTFTGVTASMTSITIKFTATSTSNCRIDDIVLKGSLTTPVTVTSAGYATFASAYPVDYSDVDGLTAYTASTDGDKVSFTEAGKVSANQGVLIKAAAGNYNVPVIANASTITNAFVGVTESTVVNGAGIYVLYNGDKGIGFYRTTATSFTVGAHSAYLPADVVSARAFIWFDEEGETTGIANANVNLNANDSYYNLNGQRVDASHKGIVIVNGKKFVNK